MTKLKTLLTTAVALALAGPAFAQNNAITLQVNAGQVMTSTGGEFVPAASGAALVPGEKLMVTAGASATAVYPNGAGINFTVPGVYTIAAGGSIANTIQKQHGAWDPKIAIGVGAAVVVAGAVAAGGGGSSNNSTPISAGKR